MTENIPEGMTREEVRAIGENNTIRYRGYYFDVETEFYYLQSRYYDSGYCRFINSDLPEYAQIGKDDYAGTNLFVYCNNDPVNNTDSTGFKKKNKNIYVFFYYDKRSSNNFDKEAKHSAYYNYYNKNVYARAIDNVYTLAKCWNQMKDPYKVYLYLHGGKGKLHFKDVSYSSKLIYQLCNFVNVSGSVYLFSCKGGAGSKGNKVANVFAKLSSTYVYALPVGVSYGSCGVVGNEYYARVRTLYYNSKSSNTYWHKYWAKYFGGKWHYYSTNLKIKKILY